MSAWRTIPLVVKLDGEQIVSETVCVTAGAHALTIVTALPDRGLAIELSSSFVGDEDVATRATHLVLGPPGHKSRISVREYENAHVDPVYGPRDCAYEHVAILLEELTELGYEVSIEVPDDAFEELEGG
ncbi:MAG TPA: hypothetical protein VGX69_01830 [Solirubrobacteraceae bacterium]|nr:hypothetical protein [Solirubrobacteraceae bacterium]